MSLFGIFKKDKNIKGFSLVEMVVVLAIATILMAIGSSMFTKYRKNTKLREATQIFMTDIKLAKQKAAAENSKYKVAFNRADDTVYYIEKLDAGGNVITDKTITKNLHDVDKDVSFRKVSSTQSDNSFDEQPRGTSTGGYVVLQNKNKKIKIVINQTGRMTIDQNYTE
jgi:prepilin-type N-terminal cleavage/methylation domain-containing protein